MIRVEDWALVEDAVDSTPHARTLFNLSNGFLGLRGALEEDPDLADQAFVNGFFETWPITYPEDAYGLARVGQTIQPVPNPGSFTLVVNGVEFDPYHHALSKYERRLDFATGHLRRDLIWTTPDGIAVRITTTRLVSFRDRGVALLTYEICPAAACTVELEHALRLPATGTNQAGLDPRKATRLDNPVHVVGATTQPPAVTVATPRSGLTITCALAHTVATTAGYTRRTEAYADRLATVVGARLGAGQSLTLTVIASFDADPATARTTLDRVVAERLVADQRAYLRTWWEAADVTATGPEDQQGMIRWNLFQTLQASARADGAGIAAKGVSGSGYDGHYFWDCEAMVLPCLTYTRPELAQAALSYRHATLPQARARAAELHQQGAAFAWRTIDGREASAFFEAGTAQFHINADIAYALNRYLEATGDLAFLKDRGIDLFVETARLWADLGFTGRDGAFHIHGVTGPDEYSALADDNLYTNVMAAANLTAADHWLGVLAGADPAALDEAVSRLGIRPEERAAWRDAAGRIALPYDDALGIHGQDAHFLGQERWDFAGTPATMYPLLLHFHPLTIYRHQVLKQADLVLALLTRPDLFTPDQKRADFDYYDAITTGDSTLSASTQAIVAAEVGHLELAQRYFRAALATDLDDSHANTGDGVHVASAASVWSMLVFGFAGFRDYGAYTLDPHLPPGWERLAFTLRLRASKVRVELTPGTTRLTLTGDDPVTLTVSGHPVTLTRNVRVWESAP